MRAPHYLLFIPLYRIAFRLITGAKAGARQMRLALCQAGKMIIYDDE